MRAVVEREPGPRMRDVGGGVGSGSWEPGSVSDIVGRRLIVVTAGTESERGRLSDGMDGGSEVG